MRRSILVSLIVAGAFAGILLFLASMTMTPAAAGPLEESGNGLGPSPVGAVVGTPDVGILKFLDESYARPGGVYVYGIYYYNDGDGVAENTIITDTLPSEVTYAGDTSGLPHFYGSGTVTWDIGTLPPGDSAVIMVTVNVPGNVMTGTGKIEENCVELSTTTPGDPDPNDQDSCLGPIDVWEDEVEIGVDKWPDFDDPVQGQEFFYTVQVCNHRGAAAGPIWLTDTLPASTTLVEWNPEPWWQIFWMEVSQVGDELVLYAPGLPGDWCSQVELTLQLDDDISLGTSLVNEVDVSTEDDVYPDNDNYVHDWAEVSPPRSDLWLDKRIHGSVLVPGGWINYFVDYGNQGNVTSTVRITDTIPDGLSYESASWGGDQPGENEPLPDPTIIGNKIIWDLSELPIRGNRWFHIQMNISDTLTAGTEIKNCAVIGGDAGDDTPDDNEDCVSVDLNEPGPNLRVYKEHDWNGDDRLYYQIQFENLGDEPVSDVWITDTLPLDTHWSGDWSSDWGGLTAPISDSGKLSWDVGTIEPGVLGWIDFNADLDGGPELFRWYTNTVEITTVTEDVDKSDNVDEDVAFSGGEVDWVNVAVFGNNINGEVLQGPVTVKTAGEEQGSPWDGYFDFDFDQPFQPGDVVTVTAGSGLQSVVINVPDPYDINADSQTRTVSGQIDHLDQELIEAELDNGPRLNTQTDANGYYSFTFPNFPRGGEGEVRYQTEIDFAEVTFHGRFRSPDMVTQVNYGHNWVEGEYEPGHTVWITVTESDGSTVKGQAELTSEWNPDWNKSTFSTNQGGWLGDHPDLLPGDWVFGKVDNGYTSTVHIGEIQEDLDLENDTVSGTLSAPWDAPVLTAVSCEIWEEGSPDNIWNIGVNPAGGSFFCDYSGKWDIQPNHTVSVRYYEPDGDQVISSFTGPWMRVNYGDDRVGANYKLGTTFWITVTDDTGKFKASAEMETDSGGGWGAAGFQTRDEDWTPRLPDIVPDDWVYFEASDGYENAIQVGVIDGYLDVDSDSITGTISADWFGSTLLDVECHPWGASDDVPSQHSDAAADGSKPYACAWTEWDIQPGQDVAVMYLEPDDGDRVINTFADPAPEMRVWKWAEGSGQVAPGGPVVFSIEYENDGDALADPVVITDTLPSNTTYISDTSGVQAVLDSGQVTWVIDPLAPGERRQFQLVLENSADPDDWLTNQVDITAPFDRENDDKHAEAEVQVVEGQPDLYVNKHAQPNDPTPGQTFLYEIDYGNEQPVASGRVVLTDTLPENTTVVDWYSDNGYDVWLEVSRDDKLVLEAPSIPGNWGDRIVLRLKLDQGVSVGTRLTNTVAITTAGDTDPDDNYREHNDAWVNEPRWNGYVDKWFSRGGLVPGGEVNYDLNVQNDGNMTSHFWLTDTLPAGTTLLNVWAWDGQQNSSPWPDIDGQVATWDLGEMEPGERFNLDLRLGIDPQVQPGDLLINCATVGIDGDDDWPFDDEACVEETVRETGPNLRISKDTWWEGDGWLAYDIHVENLGTEVLENVYFTDTYPLQTIFNDDWWVQHGPDIELSDHNDGARQLTFWVERFDPDQTASVRVNVALESGIVGDQGLAFTNTVEAPIEGDVYPLDNEYEVTSVSGPDIYAEKWLSGGEPRPGAIVTYTVEFGNRNGHPWWTGSNNRITDTLPAEMTFISASEPWNPDNPWDPEILPNNTLAWDWDDMCPDCFWQFELVVQITDTVKGGTPLVNLVEMYSQDDTEYDLDNNEFDYTVAVLDYKLYLPVVIK